MQCQDKRIQVDLKSSVQPDSGESEAVALRSSVVKQISGVSSENRLRTPDLP